MNDLDILTALNFGSDVAESEENLSEIFIPTSDFCAVLADEVDVIRGQKGIGKSAIYRMLTSNEKSFRELANIYVVPASNVTGTPIFRDLVSNDADEDTYRVLWLAYIGAVAANHTVNSFANEKVVKTQLKEVEEFLIKTGLRTKEVKKKSLLSRIRDARSLCVEFGVTDAGLPTIGFKMDLGSGEDTIKLNERSFLELIELLIEIHSALGTKCWIAMDRLDEAFSHDVGAENKALRALIQAHLAICAIGSGQKILRPKIFLRTDIYERITRDKGLTNVTHLRDIEIIWTAGSIIHLVTNRVIATPLVRQALENDGVDVSNSLDIWRYLCPETIERRRSDSWLVSSLSDGSGAYSPRNALTFLIIAHRRALDIVRRNPERYDAPPILPWNALQGAFGVLSRKRLDDTILAEHADLRPFVDRMRGGVATYSDLRTFLVKIGCGDLETKEQERILDRLCYVGIVKKMSATSLAIPYLYRPALKAGAKDRSDTME